MVVIVRVGPDADAWRLIGEGFHHRDTEEHGVNGGI